MNNKSGDVVIISREWLKQIMAKADSGLSREWWLLNGERDRMKPCIPSVL